MSELENQRGPGKEISYPRLAGLALLFFLIAAGLGYPALTRYDPPQVPSLSDVRSYVALVMGSEPAGPPHLRFRKLVPWIAAPFYHLAKGHVGSWDPAIFGLLVADSLFVAGTALLIIVLATKVFSYPVSLLAAMLYLVNFAVPNLRLVGLVDAGEGFFLLALLWALSEDLFWILPAIGILGALTKESFIPFSIVFETVWWIVVRRQLDSPLQKLMWIVVSWLAALLAFFGVQWSVDQRFVAPWQFAAGLHRNRNYLGHLASSLWDREFWYIFLWLLPLGIPHLRRFPKSWLWPLGATSLTAFALDAYYAGAPGTIGRALFSIAGPVLALSAASFLLTSPQGISPKSLQD